MNKEFNTNLKKLINNSELSISYISDKVQQFEKNDIEDKSVKNIIKNRLIYLTMKTRVW